MFMPKRGPKVVQLPPKWTSASGISWAYDSKAEKVDEEERATASRVPEEENGRCMCCKGSQKEGQARAHG